MSLQTIVRARTAITTDDGFAVVQDRTAARNQKKVYGHGYYGRHGEVSICRWTRSSLRGGQPCYKQLFYGIKSHRCIQLSPATNYCTQHCDFCWRAKIYKLPGEVHDWPAPDELLYGLIEEHRKLLSGFKGNPMVSAETFREAMYPNMSAISLSGEALLYPELGKMIRLMRDSGICTFLVTNGTLVEEMRKLECLPTQLYLTVAASNRTEFNQLLKSEYRDGWERLQDGLALASQLDTRVVLRHTLVKGRNMDDPNAYAELTRLADPDWIECKGYSHMGGATSRNLGLSNMPTLEEIRSFSQQLCTAMDDSRFRVLAQNRPSRVVLMGSKIVHVTQPETKIPLPACRFL